MIEFKKEKGAKPEPKSEPIEKKGAEKSAPVPKARRGDDHITLKHPSFTGNAEGIGLYVDGVEEHFSVTEGILKLPRFSKDGEDQKSLKIRNLLTAEKWADLTDYGWEEKEPLKVVPQAKTVKWTFRHPAGTDQNRLNCMIGVFVNGEEKMIPVKDNEVIAGDVALAAVLEKEGFILLSTKQERTK